jgi:hypothetical protein
MLHILGRSGHYLSKLRDPEPTAPSLFCPSSIEKQQSLCDCPGRTQQPSILTSCFLQKRLLLATWLRNCLLNHASLVIQCWAHGPLALRTSAYRVPQRPIFPASGDHGSERSSCRPERDIRDISARTRRLKPMGEPRSEFHRHTRACERLYTQEAEICTCLLLLM